MEINRFYLGILILNILLLNWLMNIFNVHSELLTYIPAWECIGIMILGIIGLICNTFNAFEKEKVEHGTNRNKT